MGLYGNLVSVNNNSYGFDYNIIESTINECNDFNLIIKESYDIINEGAVDNIKRAAKNIISKINKLLDKIKDFFRTKILDILKKKVKEVEFEEVDSKNMEKSISYDTLEYSDIIGKILDLIEDKKPKINNINDLINESEYKVHISSIEEAKEFINEYKDIDNNISKYMHELENNLKEEVKYWEDIIKDNNEKAKSNKDNDLTYKMTNTIIEVAELKSANLRLAASSLALKYICKCTADVNKIINMIS